MENIPWVHDTLKLLQACLKTGSLHLEINLSRKDIQVRCHGPAEKVVLSGSAFSKAQIAVQGDDSVVVHLPRSMTAGQVDAEESEIKERLKLAPAKISLNGVGMDTGWDVKKHGYWFATRRFFLADPPEAAFSFRPIVGSKISDLSVKQQLSAIAWKQDSCWPRKAGHSVQGPRPQILESGMHSLLCQALVTLGCGPRKRSGIGWIQHGVWLGFEECDLGFPSAFALCSANSLPTEGFRVLDTTERKERVKWLESECLQLAMEANQFRNESYPPVISPLVRFGSLAVGGVASISTGLAWPLVAGIVAGRGLDWVSRKRAAAEFWKQVDALRQSATGP